MNAAGATMDDLRSLSALDPTDEKLCQAMRRFFRALPAVEGPSGRRLRAEIAYGMATNQPPAQLFHQAIRSMPGDDLHVDFHFGNYRLTRQFP